MRKNCSSVILNFSRLLRPRKVSREKVLQIRGRRPWICNVFEMETFWIWQSIFTFLFFKPSVFTSLTQLLRDVGGGSGSQPYFTLHSQKRRRKKKKKRSSKRSNKKSFPQSVVRPSFRLLELRWLINGYWQLFGYLIQWT